MCNVPAPLKLLLVYPGNALSISRQLYQDDLQSVEPQRKIILIPYRLKLMH